MIRKFSDIYQVSYLTPFGLPPKASVKNFEGGAFSCRFLFAPQAFPNPFKPFDEFVSGSVQKPVQEFIFEKTGDIHHGKEQITVFFKHLLLITVSNRFLKFGKLFIDFFGGILRIVPIKTRFLALLTFSARSRAGKAIGTLLRYRCRWFDFWILLDFIPIIENLVGIINVNRAENMRMPFN